MAFLKDNLPGPEQAREFCINSENLYELIFEDVLCLDFYCFDMA